MMEAVLSADEKYRYALWRDQSSLVNKGELLFVMLNPSTADGESDDPTIRRCCGYAERLGYATLAVANLYAFRATDPADLYAAPEPVGPDNDRWIADLAAAADRIIVAWGADVGPVADRAETVLKMLGEVDALGLTASGQPRHPLYLRTDAEAVAYA